MRPSIALALGGGEQALQGLGLVEAGAQVDPGVERQEGAERDVVGLQAGQQDRDDRERGRGPLGGGLPVEAELDLAVLPAADAGWAEQDDERAAVAEGRLELRLPGPAAGQGVAVEEGAQAARLIGRAALAAAPSARGSSGKRRNRSQGFACQASISDELSPDHYTCKISLASRTAGRP